FLMSQLGDNSDERTVIWRLFVLGIGLGPTQSLLNIVSHSSAPVPQLGVATSTSMFPRQRGGMSGVSIFGALLISQITAHLHASYPMITNIDLGEMQRLAIMAADNPAAINLTGDMQQAVSGALAQAMSHIFTVSLLIIALALIV